MQRVNMTKRNSDSYVGSAYVNCASDMMQIEEIRALVRGLNKSLAEAGAIDQHGTPLRYRVCLKGREAIQKAFNPRTGNPISYDTWNGDVIGGLSNAARLDVYIQRRR